MGVSRPVGRVQGPLSGLQGPGLIKLKIEEMCITIHTLKEPGVEVDGTEPSRRLEESSPKPTNLGSYRNKSGL